MHGVVKKKETASTDEDFETRLSVFFWGICGAKSVKLQVLTEMSAYWNLDSEKRPFFLSAPMQTCGTVAPPKLMTKTAGCGLPVITDIW